nr:hypothetical protein [Bacillus cereus]
MMYLNILSSNGFRGLGIVEQKHKMYLNKEKAMCGATSVKVE